MDKKIELLTAENSVVLLIDYQPQMAFGVANIDRQMLKNNAVSLAKSAKLFAIPTTLTSVETESFSGYIWPELLDVFPDNDIIERTSMNSWDSAMVRKHNQENKFTVRIAYNLFTQSKEYKSSAAELPFKIVWYFKVTWLLLGILMNSCSYRQSELGKEYNNA